MSRRSRFVPGKDPVPVIRDGSVRGALKAAEYVLGKSRRVVPIEEATLERSGRASSEQRGNKATGAVSYDTPYAVVQHEELHFQHAPGRSAKYLENPLNESRRDVAEIIAEEVRGGLG